MDNLELKVSASPHVRSKDSTSDIMFDVVIALVPATAFGVYKFGWYAALLVAVCIISCVAFEALFEVAIHKKITVGDFSAVVTGLLIALNLPPKLPVWMAVVGCMFGIVVVKQLFGGLGQNFMNPALAARCFLLLSFSRQMTEFVYDGVATATPLSYLKDGRLNAVKLSDMFFGNIAGTIGETSVVALLIGAAYLLIKRVISPRIPLVYIGTFTVAIVIYAISKDYDVLDYTLAHLCGGGLMLGAWFMATDYVTSPITPKGKIIFGVMLGLLKFVLRIFGSGAEGVSYAIIISNLFVPLIEKVTKPKAFGAGAEKIKKSKEDSEQNKDKEKDVEKTKIQTEESEAGETSRKGFDFGGILKAVMALCIITIIMGAALGTVYNVTKKPIEESEEKAKNEAYAEVFPGASSVSIITEDKLNYDDVNATLHDLGYENDTIDELAFALDENSNILGFVVLITNSEGYGGDIQMAVGISTDNKIKGVSFLTINETVGLGMEAKEEDFRNQFVDKDTDEFFYTKNGAKYSNQIDAISGATITTSAVTDGVNGALKFIIILNMQLGLGGE